MVSRIQIISHNSSKAKKSKYIQENAYFQDSLTKRVLRQQWWRVLNVTETIIKLLSIKACLKWYHFLHTIYSKNDNFCLILWSRLFKKSGITWAKLWLRVAKYIISVKSRYFHCPYLSPPSPKSIKRTIKQYNQPNLTYPNFYFQDTLTERVLRQQRWRVLNVTETIYYATLNHSSPQVIPLFSHNLLQKCVQKMPFQPYQCHPHFDTMPNSSKYLIFEPSSE